MLEGLGAGADPEEGRRSLRNRRRKYVCIYLTIQNGICNRRNGRQTGTGGAPIVSKIAKELGVLTVGIVTIPFLTKENLKRDKAERGIQNMKRKCRCINCGI